MNWHDKGALIAWGREGRRDRVFSFLNLDWAEDPKTGFQTAAEKRLAGRLALRFKPGAYSAALGHTSFAVPKYTMGGIRAGAILARQEPRSVILEQGTRCRLVR